MDLLAVLLLILVCSAPAAADGGFFSRPVVKLAAVSADQRAIIVHKGTLTGMILSTAYTGEGDDFAWIIPTPVPATVSEAGMEGEAAFELFDTITAVEYWRWGVVAGVRGSLDTKSQGYPAPRVIVHDRVTLEHFEASILSASGAAPLLNWLSRNEYHVDPKATSILDEYVKQGWSFVTVKLRPSTARSNPDGYLPPILITYQSDRLVFPLRISAVSSMGTVGITLYVVAESTVSASNFATVPLTLNARWAGQSGDEFVESSIRVSLGTGRNAVVRMWSGRYQDGLFGEVRNRMEGGGVIELPWFKWTIEELTGITFEGGVYLTRLEARLGPSDMVADITFRLDPEPVKFVPR